VKRAAEADISFVVFFGAARSRTLSKRSSQRFAQQRTSNTMRRLPESLRPAGGFPARMKITELPA
jgi:hypothetical protein